MVLRIILILLLTNSVCFAEYFSAPLFKSDWKVKRAPSFCQLKHDIPLYGTADFVHKSGELLRFSIRESRFKPAIVRASLVIDTSPWVHETKPSHYHLVYLDSAIDIQNHPRMSVYGETAETMLDALSAGMFPTFIYERAAINGLLPETRVAISSVNFSKKYNQFVDCRKDFLPHGLKQLLEKSLYFKTASKSLNSVTLKQLKDTARYVKEVKGTLVSIVSNTASAGKKDDKWFLSRANVVAAKLNELGVPKNKVLIKKGLQPKAGNKEIQLAVFGPDALKAIYYRKGNVKLTASEKQRLALLARYTKEFMPNSRLVISSHTDSKGKRARNLKVSRQRGNVIKAYLVSQGLDEKQVQVKAYGESRPVKSNRFPTGRAQNRRATIKIVG